MPSYSQYESAPQGMTYLTGDIMPWDDYVIFRTDENTSIAVYGPKQEGMEWEDATVRIVERVTSTGYNTYYDVSEHTYSSVSVDISNPYYAYGNVIGVSYDLPSSGNISALAVSSACIVLVLIKIFQSVWSLKRSFK